MNPLISAARAAVRSGTTEAEFLAQARQAYRSIAGAPKEGRPPRSHGAWDALIAKAGTQATLASWLGVSSRTLTRWMAEREPSVDERSCPRLALMKKAKLR